MRRSALFFLFAAAPIAVTIDGGLLHQHMTRAWRRAAVNTGHLPLPRAEPSHLTAVLTPALRHHAASLAFNAPPPPPPAAAVSPRAAQSLAGTSHTARVPHDPLAQLARDDDGTLNLAQLDDDALNALLQRDGDEEIGADPTAGPAADADTKMVSVAKEAWVMAEPHWRSRKLGYLRAGAMVARAEEPVGQRGCKRGWYRVYPRGYMCHGRKASIDVDHPVAQLSAPRPNLDGLPYTYVTSRYPTPPLYARLPTLAQQQRAEPSRSYHLRKHARLAQRADYTAPPAAAPTPKWLSDGEVLPGLGGVDRGPRRVTLGRARVRSGFALLANYEHLGRRFGLTTELALIPLDRTRVVRPSALQGAVLSDEFDLPIAIVRSKHARRYRPHGQALALAGSFGWRSVLSLSGKRRSRGSDTFYELRDGSWVHADRVAYIGKFKQAPRWAKRGKKWIDVSLLRQTLVAYQGERAVYATIVSTGAGGIGDPKKTHATVQGTFLIHTKHLSVTMDGDEQGDQFDLRDVPYVQYFTAGYALHAAYWHDDFGTPRSHGCVNLAPLDAAWLFRWTDPQVPAGWHAALSLKHGTVVYVHP